MLFLTYNYYNTTLFSQLPAGNSTEGNEPSDRKRQSVAPRGEWTNIMKFYFWHRFSTSLFLVGVFASLDSNGNVPLRKVCIFIHHIIIDPGSTGTLTTRAHTDTDTHTYNFGAKIVMVLTNQVQSSLACIPHAPCGARVFWYKQRQ